MASFAFLLNKFLASFLNFFASNLATSLDCLLLSLKVGVYFMTYGKPSSLNADIPFSFSSSFIT